MMSPTWPEAVTSFEAFLRRQGLVLQSRDKYQSFGDRIVKYYDDSIIIKIVCDRGLWFVEAADVHGRLDDWYDAALLQDLLHGHVKDVLSFPEQVGFFEENWPAIVECFSVPRWQETRRHLINLKKERAKRRFPGYHS